jgi:hypothetical protein
MECIPYKNPAPMTSIEHLIEPRVSPTRNCCCQPEVKPPELHHQVKEDRLSTSVPPRPSFWSKECQSTTYIEVHRARKHVVATCPRHYILAPAKPEVRFLLATVLFSAQNPMSPHSVARSMVAPVRCAHGATVEEPASPPPFGD